MHSVDYRQLFEVSLPLDVLFPMSLTNIASVKSMTSSAISTLMASTKPGSMNIQPPSSKAVVFMFITSRVQVADTPPM